MNTVQHVLKKYFIILFIGISVFWTIGAGLGATILPWVVITIVVIFERIFLKGAIKERVARSFFIYVALIIALSILVTLILSVDGILFIIWFGIIGQACFFTCDPPILLFPFAPVFVLTGIIFIVLDLRARESIIARYKTQAALIIFGVIVLFTAKPIVNYLTQLRREARETTMLERDAGYFSQEYLESGTPSSSREFIYARDNQILVGTMDGNEPHVIAEFGLLPMNKIFLVSPGGTYFVLTRKSKDKRVDGIAEVRTVKDNILVMSITGTDIRQDELQRCKWSYDERFIACRYYGERSVKKQLVLFDVGRVLKINIYSEPYRYTDSEKRENFTWSDTTLDLFYDQEKKIYRLDNVKEMSESGFNIPAHRVSFSDLAPCFGAGVYQNGTIYCMTTTDDFSELSALSDNVFLERKDGLVIAQQVVQGGGLTTPVVINKAPFRLTAGYSVSTLYPIDDVYIGVYRIGENRPNDFFLVNINTGRINTPSITSIRRGRAIEEKVDTQNIFFTASKGAVPVPYTGAR